MDGIATQCGMVKQGGAAIILGFEDAVAIGTIGDSIVETAGTLIEAKNLGTSTDRTVNGVLFTGQLTRDDLINSAIASGFYNDGNVSTEFEAVLDSYSWTFNSPKNLNLTGLTASQTYLLQLFVCDDRDAQTRARTQEYDLSGYNSVAFENGLQYSLICRFVASTTTETITITATTPSGSLAINVNGFQVREL